MTGEGTNQYLLGRRDCVLIDAAFGEGPNVDRLERELAEFGARIVTILVTHVHPDHLGGAEGLRRRFGARLGLHASRRGFAGIEPDFVFREGDVVQFDGGRLQVLHTPGHESGHCCFFEPQRRWLFTGDHVVGQGTVVIAPPDGDMAAYLASLRRLLEVPARLLLGGHGPVVDSPRAKIQEYIDHRLAREREVLSGLDRGLRTIPQLVEEIYREVPRVLHPVAASTVEAHLRKLQAEGRVRRDGELYLPV
jgi:glyoxylase-like metal-dependent hydrolase (beta-lactamase superfamily II)